ncbi:hypothetical protein [Bacillus cereus]|uniref:hypothetical protein n=1 Tax=Bacillus cereus TaxID=1396 RepID=UPI001F2C1307|nr:hypothetical protein [Bacillus cereus]BCB35587.1 hypothetical protein BCM0045_0482 [Bacillus cereus]BCB98396.1 hypothetical protein BCM0057_0479 [Bacillus cereus]BCC21889.1 hypothetical protein BCM0079_0482 [Bacillus cereus]BCC33500.1 hypothetical protein BCM0105_0490 [Bacillus cereus]
MDKIFKERRHRFVIISVNLFMYLFILLAFYPANFVYYELSMMQYIVSMVFLLILGGIFCDRYLMKIVLLKSEKIEVFSKRQKIIMILSILTIWSVIEGITNVVINSSLISLYIATAFSIGSYYWFYFVNYYLELMESRKGKIYFKISQ